MPYTTLLIDLDETVYPSSSGVWDAISERMEQYMHARLGIDWAEIPGMRRSLYMQYGTTLRGLELTYHVDQLEYLEYVHAVPLDRLIDPDPDLRAALLRIPARKLIFTNADRNHARRVIERLGLEGCFDGVIDILDIAPYCKPMPESFEIALRMAGGIAASDCVFIDDSPRNLSAARELGFITIQVGNPKLNLLHPAADAHACITRLAELPEVLERI